MWAVYIWEINCRYYMSYRWACYRGSGRHPYTTLQPLWTTCFVLRFSIVTIPLLSPKSCFSNPTLRPITSERTSPPPPTGHLHREYIYNYRTVTLSKPFVPRYFSCCCCWYSGGGVGFFFLLMYPSMLPWHCTFPAVFEIVPRGATVACTVIPWLYQELSTVMLYIPWVGYAKGL